MAQIEEQYLSQNLKLYKNIFFASAFMKFEPHLNNFSVSWEIAEIFFSGQFQNLPWYVFFYLGHNWTLCTFSELKHLNAWNGSKNKMLSHNYLIFPCIFCYISHSCLQNRQSAENYLKHIITLFISIRKCPGITEIMAYFTGPRVLLNRRYKEILLDSSRRTPCSCCAYLSSFQFC